MQQVNILPPTWTLKGPDMLRGVDTITFVVTPHTDEKGRNFFSMVGGGHENLIDDDIVQALFGEELPKVMDDIVAIANKYDSKNNPVLDDNGQPVRVKHWDWYTIRRMTLGTALYGRKGHLNNHPIVMVWKPPKNWEPMLMTALKHLGVTDDTVVTVGISDQFMARDFIESQKKSSPVKINSKGQERLELLQKYHIATGPEKIALAKQLGLAAFSPNYPPGMTDTELEKYPFKRPHWREKGRQHGINVFDYGEENLDFRGFYESETEN